MNMYYCIDCTRPHGLAAPILPVSGLAPASGYPLQKFIEHTLSGITGKLKSIFNDPSWSPCQDYMMNASHSGCLEIDGQNRKNWIILDDKETGKTFQSGQLVESCNGVKVVLSEVSGYIHAFPFNILAGSQVCAVCGRRIPSL